MTSETGSKVKPRNLTRQFDPQESTATNSIWIGLLLTNSFSVNANTELT